MYAKHTGQDPELLRSKMERDTFLSPEEAKSMGIIDQVLVHAPSTITKKGSTPVTDNPNPIILPKEKDTTLGPEIAT